MKIWSVRRRHYVPLGFVIFRTSAYCPLASTLLHWYTSWHTTAREPPKRFSQIRVCESFLLVAHSPTSEMSSRSLALLTLYMCRSCGAPWRGLCRPRTGGRILAQFCSEMLSGIQSYHRFSMLYLLLLLRLVLSGVVQCRSRLHIRTVESSSPLFRQLQWPDVPTIC